MPIGLKHQYTLRMKNPGRHSRIRVISLIIWASEYIFFYPKLRRSLRILSEPDFQDVILDVGGNRGQSVKFFRKLFTNIPIYSYEPSPRIFEILKSLSVHNFHAFNFGISSKNGEEVFYESLLDEASTFELPNLDSDWHKTKSRVLGVAPNEMYIKTKVQIKTLDTIVEENQIMSIFLLKIDVEGHEFAVLSGAKDTLGKKMIKNIQIERHVDDLRESDEFKIGSFLNQFGFKRVASLRHSIGNFYEDVYTMSSSF